MDDQIHVRPSASLRPYLSRFWCWDYPGSEKQSIPKLLPGTGIEVAFHYGDPFICTSTGQALPPAHLICIRNRTMQFFPQGNIRFFAIRFRAGMFRYFSPVPLSECTDSIVDMGDIWGEEGRILSHRIIEAKSLAERVALAEEFLCKRIPPLDKKQRYLDYAMKRLSFSSVDSSMKDIAGEGDISLRQFQRIMKFSMGMTPTALRRNFRFENTVKPLLLESQRDYLPMALSNGYYDQAHFIKEFRGLIGTTPSKFLKDSEPMSHFYNYPLR